MQDLGHIFTNGQLAVLVAVLAAVLAWSLRSGFSRIIGSIDARFNALDLAISQIRDDYAPRAEVDAKFSGVHRRVDDLNRHLHRRWEDTTATEE